MITPTLILPHQREKSFLENWMPRSSAAGYFTIDASAGQGKNRQSLWQFLYKSDEVLRSYIQTLSFQSFTYPDQFFIPEPLRAVLEEVDKESFHQ